MQGQQELTFVAPIVPEFTVDFGEDDERIIGCLWDSEKNCYVNKNKFDHICTNCGVGFHCSKGYVYDFCNCHKGHFAKTTCNKPEHPECCNFIFCSEKCMNTMAPNKPINGPENARAWINSFCKN